MIQGIIFDEAFFDAVIKRGGGHRLTDLHRPPPNTRHVDYLINGFALELKILTTDPLDSTERQERIDRFLRSELPKGPLWVTARERRISMTGAVADRYWEWIMGAPIQDRLDQAARQIKDTLTFVPGSWKGGVLLVNSAGPSWDWLSFGRLAGKYHRRFPEIDAVFALNGVPVNESGTSTIHFAIASKKDGKEGEYNALWKCLDAAIRGEIEKRTAQPIIAKELDPGNQLGKVSFQLTAKGVRKKRG
jgi:hypothetical protein